MATAQSSALIQDLIGRPFNLKPYPARSGKCHVPDKDITSFLDLILSPHFSVMDVSEQKQASEAVSLSPSTCIKIRSVAQQNQLLDLVARCDLYMDAKLPDMLAREDVLGLSRIQVNVKVSEKALELRSDYSALDKVVPRVVMKLEEDCSSHLEEKVIVMYLLEGNQVSFSPKASPALSPEKPEGSLFLKRSNPSPARKLILDDSFDNEAVFDDQVKDTWRIVSTHKMSELSAVAVVECNGSLVLVSITLTPMIKDNGKIPVSPTTGLSFLNGTSFMAPMCIARSGFGIVEVENSLFSVGGFNREGCLAGTECYNQANNTWEPVSSLRMPRARFGITKLDNFVFVIGGSDGKKELSSVETFNLVARKWSLHESRLITPRSCFGSTALNGQIYVVGGLHYSTPLKTAEVFNPSLNRWEALPPMTTCRRDVTITSCLGKVYAIGGQTFGWSCLASVEAFDVAKKKWTELPSMKTPRRNAVAVTLDDKIYVIGGYNGSSAVRHVEVFDPMTSEWTQCPPLNVKRSYAAAAVVQDSVYVVGGFDNSTFLNSMERFDLETNKWTPFV